MERDLSGPEPAGRPARTTIRFVLVVALLAAVYVAIRLTGGTPNPLVHFLYVPIVVAATTWGWRGGLVAGTTAGLLAGPLSPDSTASSATILGTWGWALRFVAYQLAGIFAGAIFERGRAMAGEIRAAEERVRGEAALRASEARLASVIESCADGMVALDGRGVVTLANAATERILLRDRSDIVGRQFDDPIWRLGHADGAPATDLRERFGRLLAGRSHEPVGDLRAVRPDGSSVFLAVTVLPIGGGTANEAGVVITLRDVTAERALSRRRDERAADLRIAAGAAAAETTAEAAAAALLTELGRQWPIVASAIYVFEGDGSHRLAGWSAVGADAAYPSRLDGPHQAWLRELVATGRARRLDVRRPALDDDRLATMVDVGGRATLVVPLPIEGSVAGVLVAMDRRAPGPLDPDEEEALREFGRMCAAVVRRAELDEAADAARTRARVGAILDDPARLQPVFQPIVSLATSRAVAYEALARFAVEPVRSPLAWFGEAARVGLATELQALGVRRALDVAGAARLPRGAALSVNVGPGALGAPEMAAALGSRHLDRLIIEMTEGEAVHDYEPVRRAMAQLRQRGVRFAVDDAGAGYASMRHVTELRPEFVKLDAQLIRGIGDDDGRMALVRALETFAGEIGATLIAEGVETIDDVRLLARLDPPVLAQGYAIARPGPAWPAVAPGAVEAVRQARAALRRATGIREARADHSFAAASR